MFYSTICLMQNWIFFHDRRSFTDFSALYKVLRHEKTVSGVLDQWDVVITFILESLSKENQFQ